MDVLFTTLALALYLTSATLLAMRLRKGFLAARQSKLLPLSLALGAVAIHAWFLQSAVLTAPAINLSFFNMVSLMFWLVAVLVVISAFSQPLENLGIAVLPLAGMALVAQELAPPNPTLVADSAQGLQVHILLSVVSYALLALGALQAVLLAIQDRHLRNRHPGGFVRALPPLETMENLLFQFLAIGFFLLTLSLLSGAIFVENLFAQHLVHKTVLSIAAWFVFAGLLWGRWRSGWRGPTAIRWTLGGFAVLALAYFGTKLVLELILR